MRVASPGVAVGALLFAATIAAAEVTITEPLSGRSLTFGDGWTLIEDSEGSAARHEQGCIVAIFGVPEAELQTAADGLEETLWSLVDRPTIFSRTMEDDGWFEAIGDGWRNDEPVYWLLYGGIEDGSFTMVFTGSTFSADTCITEMDAVVLGL